MNSINSLSSLNAIKTLIFLEYQKSKRMLAVSYGLLAIAIVCAAYFGMQRDFGSVMMQILIVAGLGSGGLISLLMNVFMRNGVADPAVPTNLPVLLSPVDKNKVFLGKTLFFAASAALYLLLLATIMFLCVGRFYESGFNQHYGEMLMTISAILLMILLPLYGCLNLVGNIGSFVSHRFVKKVVMVLMVILLFKGFGQMQKINEAIGGSLFPSISVASEMTPAFDHSLFNDVEVSLKSAASKDPGKQNDIHVEIEDGKTKLDARLFDEEGKIQWNEMDSLQTKLWGALNIQHIYIEPLLFTLLILVLLNVINAEILKRREY